MPCDHLSEFINLLVDHRDLIRISAPVDPVQEIAAITQQVVANDGPALLFDNVLGSRFPVVTNLLGSDRRLCWALGVDSFSDVTERIKAIVQPNLPQGWLEALQLVPKFVETAQWPPRLVEIAVAQQVVKMGRDINLGELPLLRSWPNETVPVIHSAHVIVEYATAVPTSVPPLQVADDLAVAIDPMVPFVRRLISRVPVQVRDSTSCYIYWTPQSREWQLLDSYRKRGCQMPVAIALGGDLLLTYAAEAPLPAHVDPFVFTGFLRRQPIEITRARSVDLQIPAHAEVVLEGTIDPHQEYELAPPIGLSTGYYSTPQRLPVLHLTAVTHRSNPLIPAIVATSPPSELDTLARASQVLFLPLIQLAVPELIALRRPASGAYRHMLFVSIRKSYPQQARKVMNALWGLGQLATSKLIVIVDHDVDVSQDDAVWFAVASHLHPVRDTLFSDGPADMYDHATPIRGIGSRMGLDATRKSPDEGHSREWPNPLQFDENVKKQLVTRWADLGLPFPLINQNADSG